MKKLLKLFLTIALTIGLFFGLESKALAVDLVVTCEQEGPCNMSPSPGRELFYETNWLPGYTVTRHIILENIDPDYDCPLTLEVTNNTQTPSDFATKLFTEIKDEAMTLYGGGTATLDDLYGAGVIFLGNVPAGGSKLYDWTVTFDPETGNDYQRAETVFDFDLNFSCGKPQEPPALVITKDNDRKGETLAVDEIVTYTITITNDGLGTAYGVVVEDVQPVGDYFDYLEASGTLKLEPSGTPTSIVATDVGGDRYFWTIGDILPEQTYTLTYQLEILNVDIPGSHNNIAFARGTGDDEKTYFSNIVLDPFDVGKPGSLSAGYKVEQGEVLGATTIGEVLGAATGSPTFWLILALVLISLGSALKFFRNKKMRRVSQLIILISVLGISLYNPKAVLAADTQAPGVAIVQLPEYLNKRDFEISYTALDLGEAGLKNVHLEYLKEGGLWQDLGTFTEHANKTKLDGSKINEDKKYYFKATACDNENNCSSNETSTTVDTSAPPKPENYSKQKISTKTYKITWHNPDSNDLDKVYVYRADKRDFNADEGTRISSVGVSKNTDSEYMDWAVPDENKEYFYAIRSVDKAGNGSDLVGDAISISGSGATTPVAEAVSGQTTVEGQQPVVQTGTDDSRGQVLSEKDPEDEVKEGEDSQETSEVSDEKVLGETAAKKKWLWLLIIGGLGVIGIFYWFFKTSED